MCRFKSFSLLLLATIMLAACQLFEPLPTLPAVLTLEPLASDAAVGDAQSSSAPETANASPPASPGSATQPVAPATEPLATAPASSPTSVTTQAQAAATSATIQPADLPAATATRPAPTTAPQSSWHDVPIMPGATEGGEEAGAYSYIVNESVSQVRTYYNQQMPLSGWASFASGEGEAGNLLLMFQKGNTTATIGIIQQDGETLVLIVAE